MSKPKIMLYWCASCGGCEEAVLDLHEDILDVVKAVDIVFWPAAMDFKRKDVESLRDGEVLACLINGGVRTSEQRDMVALIRNKSQYVIAFGSCAHMGGIPGLANLSDRDSLLASVYLEGPLVENAEETIPGPETASSYLDLELPEIEERLLPLDEVIDVDYYLPGCAPSPRLVKDAVEALLSGALPAKGTVLAPEKALCDECPRKDSKPDDVSLSEIKRIHQVQVKDNECFLAAGVLCMGIGTRSGCDARCISANMPCNGCFGPIRGVMDHGGRLLSAVASLFAGDTAEDAQGLAESIVDPAGTFYRFGVASSILKGKK